MGSDIVPNMKKHRPENPFYFGWRRRKDAMYDFELFKDYAEEHFLEIIESKKHFNTLKKFTDFVVIPREPTAFQAGFGSRPMGWRTVGDKNASEDGATIVYSLGPSGMISTMLFPAKSDLAQTMEEVIFLRIKRMGGAPLIDCIEKDVRRLVAYERVSSLDANANFRERIWIWWLRSTCRTQTNGEHQTAKSSEWASKFLKSSSFVFWSSLLKILATPVIILLLLAILITFNQREIIDFMFPEN